MNRYKIGVRAIKLELFYVNPALFYIKPTKLERLSLRQPNKQESIIEKVLFYIISNINYMFSFKEFSNISFKIWHRLLLRNIIISIYYYFMSIKRKKCVFRSLRIHRSLALIIADVNGYFLFHLFCI